MTDKDSLKGSVGGEGLILGDSFSLEGFSRRILAELLDLDQNSHAYEVVEIYSNRPEHQATIKSLARLLRTGLRTRRISRLSYVPLVKVSCSPEQRYSIDVGVFIDGNKLPGVPAPVPERGGEFYYPEPPEKQILGPIVYGTIVDHIPRGVVWDLVSLLDLKRFEGRVSLGDHYSSSRLGSKGLLKIEGYSFGQSEGSVVFSYAPDATISLISAGKVKRKFRREQLSEMVSSVS